MDLLNELKNYSKIIEQKFLNLNFIVRNIKKNCCLKMNSIWKLMAFKCLKLILKENYIVIYKKKKNYLFVIIFLSFKLKDSILSSYHQSLR